MFLLPTLLVLTHAIGCHQLFLRVSFETQQDKLRSKERSRQTEKRRLSNKLLPTAPPSSSEKSSHHRKPHAAAGADTATLPAMSQQLVEANESAIALKAENDRLLKSVAEAQAATRRLAAEKQELETRCRELELCSPRVQREKGDARITEYESKIQELQTTIEKMRQQQTGHLRGSPLQSVSGSSSGSVVHEDELKELQREEKLQHETSIQQLTNELQAAHAEIEHLRAQLRDANLPQAKPPARGAPVVDVQTVQRRIREAVIHTLQLDSALDEASTLDEFASVVRAIPPSEDGTVPIENIWAVLKSVLHVELSGAIAMERVH